MKETEARYNRLGLGIEGLELIPETKKILKDLAPKLIIFFNRNITNTQQVQKLVKDIKEFYVDLTLPEPNFCVDVEGGLVNRLKNLDIKDNPSYQFKKAVYFAELYQTNKELAKKELYEQFTIIGKTLNNLGIDIDLAPVADLSCFSLDQHGRTYGKKPEQVIDLVKEAIRGLIENGITPVLKHAPGLRPFGEVDSHFKVPISDILPEDLSKNDLSVFKTLCAYIRDLGKKPYVMPCHGIYTNLCEQKISASVNPEMLKYLKEKLGDDIIIITDDLCMGGVSIPVGKRIYDCVDECLTTYGSNYIPLFCHPESYSKDIVQSELLGSTV